MFKYIRWPALILSMVIFLLNLRMNYFHPGRGRLNLKTPVTLLALIQFHA